MNIIDIAKLAGVSKSTVSIYLNELMQASKVEKIQDVIDKTSFVPSNHGKSLHTKNYSN